MCSRQLCPRGRKDKQISLYDLVLPLTSWTPQKDENGNLEEEKKNRGRICVGSLCTGLSQAATPQPKSAFALQAEGARLAEVAVDKLFHFHASLICATSIIELSSRVWRLAHRNS